MNILNYREEMKIKPGNDGDYENDGNRKNNKPLLATWKRFAESTSMHGLGRAVLSKMAWKRVIWSLLVIGGVIVSSLNFSKIIVNYLSYPVTTNIELKSWRTMEFPSVTICNLNPAMSLKIDKSVMDALNESIQVQCICILVLYKPVKLFFRVSGISGCQNQELFK